MGVLERGGGEPLTLFVPGGQGEHLERRMAYADQVRGTKVGFAYEGSGHFERVAGLRRGAERDAGEVRGLIDEYGFTRAVGFSRGAQAIVGALADGERRLDRIALVIPPAGRSAGKWLPWLESLTDDDRHRLGADALVIGHRGDPAHPARVAREWAERLGADLELLGSREVATHPDGVARLLAEFFS